MMILGRWLWRGRRSRTNDQGASDVDPKNADLRKRRLDMLVLDECGAGTDYDYKWPTYVERFKTWIDYRIQVDGEQHRVRIGFGSWHTFGRQRTHVVVWIDQIPLLELHSADDFETSGEVLAQIILYDGGKKHMCRFPNDAIPERYASFRCVGLPERMRVKGVWNSWAVVTTLDDHKTMIMLARLRQMERQTQRGYGGQPPRP